MYSTGEVCSYKNPSISFINALYASPWTPTPLPFSVLLETPATGPEMPPACPSGLTVFTLLPLGLGTSRRTRKLVGMNLVTSAWIFLSCGWAEMMAP